MKIRLTPLFLLAHSISALDFRCSSRQNRKAGPPCVFPYKIDGELYLECTTYFRPENQSIPESLIARPICPTRNVSPSTLEASQNIEDWAECDRGCLLMDYRTNAQMNADLIDLGERYPALAMPFVIGVSHNSQPLMGLRLTRNVRGRQQALKPMVRLVSNLNGDEASGREILTHFALHLLYMYEKDPRITDLLDTTDISIIPSINPDGFEKAHKGSCSGTRQKDGANNGNNVDLSKSFPTWKEKIEFDTNLDYNPFSNREPETEALMNWSANNPFVLGLNLHDGAVLVTYPHDYHENKKDRGPNQTPDQDVFIHLAQTYVTNHKTLTAKSGCYFRADGGMANGAQWLAKYKKGAVAGTMKDFSYLFTNNLEISVGVSCCKYPVRFALFREWRNNKDSLLAFIEEVHRGVKGVVFLPDNTPVSGADLRVWNPDGTLRGKNSTTSENGEYWKVLLPSPTPYKMQAVFEDCDGSGLKYASSKLRVLVTEKSPISTRLIFLRHVGFCEKKAVPAGYENLVDEFGIFARDASEL